MLVAIYGGCCTGKTTISKQLVEYGGYPVRHCGQYVVEEAARQGVQPSALSAETHKQIDHQTREWCVENGSKMAVVEGRFLHFVLAKLSFPIILVQCTASLAFRQDCIDRRHLGSIENMNPQQADNEDMVLCALIYEPGNLRQHDLYIDTSRSSVAECVEQVLCKIRIQQPG
jgi:cytidylate kinase